jgi:hypothetical protein
MDTSGAPASPASISTGDRLLRRSVSKGYDALDASVDNAVTALQCLEIMEESQFATRGNSVRAEGGTSIKQFVATARSTFAAIFGEVEEASVLHGLVFRLCKRCGFEPRSPAPVDIDALVDPPPPTPTPTIPRATRPRVVQPLLEVKCDLCGVAFTNGTNRARRKQKVRHLKQSCIKVGLATRADRSKRKNVRCVDAGCLVAGCIKKGGAFFFNQSDLKRHRTASDINQQKAAAARQKAFDDINAMLTQQGSSPTGVGELEAGWVPETPLNQTATDNSSGETCECDP